MKKNFYVYIWVRKDKESVFYVGKGSGRRAGKRTLRSDYFKRILNSTECYWKIILKNLSNKQALKKEIEFIAFYKKLGMAQTNFTAGGDGRRELPHSKETIEKMKKSNKRVTAKKVIDISNGKIYISSREAAKDIGMSPTTLNYMLRNDNPNKTSLRYLEKINEPLKPESNLGKKIRSTEVIDEATGTIYKNLYQAAKSIGMRADVLSKFLNGTTKNKTTLCYYDPKIHKISKLNT